MIERIGRWFGGGIPRYRHSGSVFGPTSWLMLFPGLMLLGCEAPTPVVIDPPGSLGPGTSGRWVRASPAGEGLDSSVLNSFGDRLRSGEFGTVSTEEKLTMTLEHVLQMRTGFEWDESSLNYTDPNNPTSQLAASSDLAKHTLDLPLSDPPGTRFVYNSAATMLLSGVVREIRSESAEDFARVHLFEPLSLSHWYWEQGAPAGFSNSGWGLRLRPEDMAALGQLVLQDGRWNESQIVGTDWVARSVDAATEFESGMGYGYQWWLPTVDGVGRVVAAWGWGGQFIVVIPSLDMVVVSTAENYGGGGLHPTDLAELAGKAAGVRNPSR